MVRKETTLWNQLKAAKTYEEAKMMVEYARLETEDEDRVLRTWQIGQNMKAVHGVI